MLRASADALCDTHDLVLLDLDGVVYIGRDAVPGAAEAIASGRERGLKVAFVTNNAARPARAVAAHLHELGIEAVEHEVVTSAQAAAHLVAHTFPPGTPVLALGGEGVWEALTAAGLRPVADVKGSPQAVVTGYGPDLTWREIMRAAVLIRDGLPWVACNADLTIPTDFGVAPGHGVLVELLERFTGVHPPVAGKPERPLLDEAIARLDGSRPLMVGDRLDTDIEGAHAAGVDSLLVLTGVTGLAELLAAGPGARPTYLSLDLGGLLAVHPPVTRHGTTWHSEDWHASVVDGAVELRGTGSIEGWWRVAASAAWAAYDDEGVIVTATGLTPGLPFHPDLDR